MKDDGGFLAIMGHLAKFSSLGMVGSIVRIWSECHLQGVTK